MMSKWAVMFLLLALISGLFGFVGPGATACPSARLLFNLFLFLFLGAVFVRNVWQTGSLGQAWRDQEK